MTKNHLFLILSLMCFKSLISQEAFGQQTLKNTPVTELSIKQLTTIIEHHPDDLQAHENFLHKMRVFINDSLITVQYNLWMNRFPKSAIVPFAIGKAFQDYHDVRAKNYLMRAVAINPEMSEAWEQLAYCALITDDKLNGIEYMRKAVKYSPKNVDYSFKYALLNKDGDPSKYDSLMLNVAYRFPNTDRAAEAIYYLASSAFNATEKTAYYEVLYKEYSKNQPPWSILGMKEYFDYLINTSPEKAFALALPGHLVQQHLTLAE